jgi:hypothetical protein
MKEGVKYNPENGNIQINFIKGSDSTDDDLKINRANNILKKAGFDVYYGLTPPPGKSHQELVDLANRIKDLSNINSESTENLKKIVINSSPHLPITHLIAVNSKHPLVKVIVDVLKVKYRSTLKGSSHTKKVEYSEAWDMVNAEKFSKADPITQNMVRSWINCVEKNFTPPYTINKSGINGKCGLQSGARGLLNHSHDAQINDVTNNKYLVVDDVIIGGSTFKDIFGSLLKNSYINVNNKNLFGYTLINLL